MPRRSKNNAGLPKRWRYRYGSYYYLVPKGEEEHWDGKTEFKLGRTLARAHEVFAQRLVAQEDKSTMAALIDRYTREVTPTKSPRTRKDEVEIFKRLRAMVGSSRAAAFQTHHCYQVYEALKPRGLTTANRHMEKLSHLFTKGLEWGSVHAHPMVQKFRKEHPEPNRTYVSDEQLQAALKAAPPLIKAYVELKLLTGLRMSDMLRLKVRDWDKNEGLKVTPSKTRKSSGVSLIFEPTPALEAAIDAILALPRPHITEYLFCTRSGDPYLKPDGTMNGFQSIWQRWQAKLEHRFKERDIRVKVGSDQETDAEAARILGHAPGSATTRKHYRAKPLKVRPAR